MAADHLHSAESGCHPEDCDRRRSVVTRSMVVPLVPLRWLVLGCVGLAVFGIVLPFSPIPPCPLLTMTGVPCPMCGMTRSVRSLMRLDAGGALRFQPFGVVAFLGGLVILSLWALPRTRSIDAVRVPVMVVFAAFLASWIWNIGFNPTFA